MRSTAACMYGQVPYIGLFDTCSSGDLDLPGSAQLDTVNPTGCRSGGTSPLGFVGVNSFSFVAVGVLHAHSVLLWFHR